MAPLANKGYDLYTDRYYTSPQLARTLLEISTTISGTVMVNKRGMPAATKEKSKKKRERSAHTRMDHLLLCSGQTKGHLPLFRLSMATIWFSFHQGMKMMSIAQKSRIIVHDIAMWCVGERRGKGNVDEGKVRQEENKK